MFVRDLTFSNTSGTAIHVHASVGPLTDPSNRVIDQDMPANVATFIRPLWLLDTAETLEALQVVASVPTPGATAASVTSAVDGTAFVTGAWTPGADKLYLLYVFNGVASGTTALNPSSITGNGSWTHVAGTTSTVAAAGNVAVDVWYWYSAVAGGNATTTVNFASTQHSCLAFIVPWTNVYSGVSSIPPWTSGTTPIVQSATAADSVAPGSTTDSKTVTLATLQTGQVIYFHARALGTLTATPPTGMTETVDSALDDVTGSQGKITAGGDYVTAPPWTSTTVGPATYSAAGTQARVGVAIEVVPSAWVNCMVSGIEVH